MMFVCFTDFNDETEIEDCYSVLQKAGAFLKSLAPGVSELNSTSLLGDSLFFLLIMVYSK